MPRPAEPAARVCGEQAQATTSRRQGAACGTWTGISLAGWFTDCWCPRAGSSVAPRSPGGVLAELFPKFAFQSNFQATSSASPQHGTHRCRLSPWGLSHPDLRLTACGAQPRLTTATYILPPQTYSLALSRIKPTECCIGLISDRAVRKYYVKYLTGA